MAQIVSPTLRSVVGALGTGTSSGARLGSAEGVFTLRSNYPQALRALGREQDATRAQQQVNGLTPVPSTVAPAPDPFALQLAAERARTRPEQRFTG